MIELIAEKQVATAAIQGKFSVEGISAMAEGVDARSAADSAYTAAVEKATEMGLISEQK